MHTNPGVFPEPLKFDPERWLKEDSAGLLNYLVPFSRGQRQCIGMKYVCSLAQSTDFSHDTDW